MSFEPVDQDRVCRKSQKFEKHRQEEFITTSVFRPPLRAEAQRLRDRHAAYLFLIGKPYRRSKVLGSD